MNSRFEELLDVGTLALVGSVPEGGEIVIAQWVFKKKIHVNGKWGGTIDVEWIFKTIHASGKILKVKAGGDAGPQRRWHEIV